MAGINTADAPQIQIKFVTKQTQFAVPDNPFSVSVNIIPDELNILVNQILKDSGNDKQVEFDFLVCSELLRTSLSEHINERGASTEDVIDVEYLEKHPPPEPQDCLVHDDWVSAVAVSEKW
ncbi:GSCOCG00000662001-RA-CDS [Cotesia congregata]|nr:GSCOCG00000662001-RA-CDS [Cotesia congregata]